MRKYFITIGFILPALSAHAQAGGDAAAGREKARLCAGCHSIEGYRNAYPAYSVPKLGGQHADYLAAALRGYRSGERAHPTMHAIASTLNDQDVADLAAYFAATAGGRP
jgi:cytochrome c553